MSRYLEMSVEGIPERVGERALRAFRRIGKIQRADLSSAIIEGTIKIHGEVAHTRVTWRPEGDSRSRLDIAASSDDTLNRAADSALYTYARTYKAIGWPDPEKDRLEQKQRRAHIGKLALVAIVLGVGVGLYLVAAGFFRS
jgi:hypothetical protein